jgi:hypothetical protein
VKQLGKWGSELNDGKMKVDVLKKSGNAPTK